MSATKNERPGSLGERLGRLEKERAHPPEATVSLGNASRFGALEQEHVPVEQPAIVEVPRFQPPVEQLDVAPKQDDEQPFVRCAACQSEGGKFAEVCPTCGARFDTPEQRRFNEIVWQERRAQQAREQEEERAHQAELLADATHDQLLRQQRAQAIAREALESARARLDPLGAPGLAGLALNRSPLLALLARLPRFWAVLLGLVLLLPLGLLRLGHRGDWVRILGGAWLGLLVLLTVPPSWWFRSRSRWFD